MIRDLDPAAAFEGPAGEAALAAAEGRLKVRLPQELRSLLAASDGVTGAYGLGLVWSLGRIVRDNESFRIQDAFGGCMALDSLLFCADAGDGELFGHPIARNGVGGERVFAWNPIDDSRTLVATALGDYLRRWLDGSLRL